MPSAFVTVLSLTKLHPGVRNELRKVEHTQQMVAAIRTAATDSAVLTDSSAVSPLSLVQFHLGCYCPEFWQALSEGYIASWDAPAAADVVFAYGLLSRTKRAPQADALLSKFFFSILETHLADLSARSLANIAFSLAQQFRSFQHMLQPVRETVRNLACKMNAEDVCKTACAFATVHEELGSAEQALRHSIELQAESMNPQHVADLLWASAMLKWELGTAQGPLMVAVARVADSMNADQVATVLWAVGTSKRRTSIVLGPSQAPVLQAAARLSGGQQGPNVLRLSQLRQVRAGLQWLQKQGDNNAEMQKALQNLQGAK